MLQWHYFQLIIFRYSKRHLVNQNTSRHSSPPERCDFTSSQQYNNVLWSLFIMFWNQNSNHFNKFIEVEDSVSITELWYNKPYWAILWNTTPFPQMLQTWKSLWTFSSFMPTKSHCSAGGTVPLIRVQTFQCHMSLAPPFLKRAFLHANNKRGTFGKSNLLTNVWRKLSTIVYYLHAYLGYNL